MFERFEVFRVLLIIFLVIILSGIKLHRRQNLSHDRFFKFAGMAQLFLRQFRSLLFLIAAVKNCGPLAWTDIGDLAVGLCWIDLLPLSVGRRLVGHFCRVLSYLYCFSVVV